MEKKKRSMPLQYFSAGKEPLVESRRRQSDTAEGMAMRAHPRKIQPEGSRERVRNGSPLRATAEHILTQSPAYTRNYG